MPVIKSRPIGPLKLDDALAAYKKETAIRGEATSATKVNFGTVLAYATAQAQNDPEISDDAAMVVNELNDLLDEHNREYPEAPRIEVANKLFRPMLAYAIARREKEKHG